MYPSYTRLGTFKITERKNNMLELIRNKDPTQNSKRYTLLQLTAISGELPYSEIRRIFDSNSYAEKIITELKNNDEITVFNKDKYKGYRLTKKSKSELINNNSQRFEFYLTGTNETNRIKSELRRRLRLHRTAEIYITMLKANITIFRDEKPNIFVKLENSPVETKVLKPCFYNSIEIKNYGDEMKKINSSRMIGYLLTLRKVFIVYNTNNTVMKWNYNSEYRNFLFAKHTFCKKIANNFYNSKDTQILIFGKSIEVLLDLLMTNIEIPKKNHFRVNYEFESMLFLTNDNYGEILLKLLCDEDKLHAFYKILSKDYLPQNSNYFSVNDAIDTDGTPVLFCCVIDLIRITKFYSALNMNDRKGRVICFDFQQAVLENYFGDNVVIEALNFEKFNNLVINAPMKSKIGGSLNE